MDIPHRLAACVLEIKITALQTQFQWGLNITHTHPRPPTHTHARTPTHTHTHCTCREWLQPLALAISLKKTTKKSRCFPASIPVTAGIDPQYLQCPLIFHSKQIWMLHTTEQLKSFQLAEQSGALSSNEVHDYKLRRGRHRLSSFCLQQQMNAQVKFSALLRSKVSELYICCFKFQKFVHLSWGISLKDLQIMNKISEGQCHVLFSSVFFQVLYWDFNVSFQHLLIQKGEFRDSWWVQRCRVMRLQNNKANGETLSQKLKLKNEIGIFFSLRCPYSGLSSTDLFQISPCLPWTTVCEKDCPAESFCRQWVWSNSPRRGIAGPQTLHSTSTSSACPRAALPLPSLLFCQDKPLVPGSGRAHSGRLCVVLPTACLLISVLRFYADTQTSSSPPLNVLQSSSSWKRVVLFSHIPRTISSN